MAEINIDDSTIVQIINCMNDKISESENINTLVQKIQTKGNGYKRYKQLRKAAHSFLNQIKNEEEYRQNYAYDSEDLTTLIEKVRKTKEVFTKAAYLENAYYAFLQIETHHLYINLGKNGILFGDLNLPNAYEGHNGTIKVSQRTKGQAMSDELKQLEQSLKDYENIYKTAISRYNEINKLFKTATHTSTYTDKKTNKEKEKNNSYEYFLQGFYWKSYANDYASNGESILFQVYKSIGELTPQTFYSLGPVYNKGDIGEAFIALAAKKPSKMDSTDIEKQLQYFHLQYVQKVDSLNVLIGQDIDLGLVQYAVKSTNSRPPALSQFVLLAQMVQGQRDWKTFITEQLLDLIKETNKNASYRNSISEATKKTLTTEIKEKLKANGLSYLQFNGVSSTTALIQ